MRNENTKKDPRLNAGNWKARVEALAALIRGVEVAAGFPNGDAALLKALVAKHKEAEAELRLLNTAPIGGA